ncbi:8645_t:CDS:2 [Ambispora leptoticha]|uniref:8645_t:CDS:1 n=1 Tax=Ambispora leptoticha TaxID=144679 RepID=A0A9N9CV10_9GLOM|nr:8645_t:CDS:2 [Ambispora leptoticha]
MVEIGKNMKGKEKTTAELKKISESEQLNKRTKTILSSSHHKTPRNFAVKPIHPGEILREELLIPRNITPEELAQEIKRLSIYFDTSVELWLNLQRSYEEELSEASLESLKEEIIPYKEKCINGRHLETN